MEGGIEGLNGFIILEGGDGFPSVDVIAFK
jgi:hypothetical protein